MKKYAKRNPVQAPRSSEVAAWLRDNLDHKGTNCLKYPFFINPKLGYVQFRLDGKTLYAHRWMCEQKNGPAPTPKHEAAHTCGNAHMGCMNPNHLQWKTRKENAGDRLKHGNYSDHSGKRHFRLTPAQVDEIRSLKGVESQYSMAERFGVSRCTISSIHCGRMYASRKRTALGPEQVRAILSAKGSRPAEEVATEHGVHHGTIRNIWSGRSHRAHQQQREER